MFHMPAHHHAYPLAQPAQVAIEPLPQRHDFVLADHGSILVLTPLSDEGRQWIDEHLTDPETQRWGRGVVFEPRYWEPIQGGIFDAGLSIAD